MHCHSADCVTSATVQHCRCGCQPCRDADDEEPEVQNAEKDSGHVDPPPARCWVENPPRPTWKRWVPECMKCVWRAGWRIFDCARARRFGVGRI